MSDPISRFFYDNRAVKNYATVAATTEATNFPATNLLTHMPGRVWNSTDKTTHYLTVSLPSTETIKAVFLNTHNITVYTTFEMQYSNDSGFSTHTDVALTNAYSTRYTSDSLGMTAAENIYYAYCVGTYSARYFRIKIVAASNPGSYFEAGNLFLFAGDRTISNYVVGYQSGYDVENQKIVGQYGQSISVNRFSMYTGTYNFTPVEKSDSDFLHAQLPVYQQVFFAPEGITSSMYYGHFDSNIPNHLLYEGSGIRDKEIQVKFTQYI